MLSEEWDLFFQNNPNGGPWDISSQGTADDHVVNFITNNNFETNLKVLDCGCADGRNSAYLIDCGFDVTGIDQSSTVIERTQKRYPNGNFIVGDVRELPLEDNSFDIIIDAGALHVNHPEDIDSILKEYHRVIKDSGKFFIRVFNQLDCYDNGEPIFYVDTDTKKLPVYGYSEAKFSNYFKGYFDIEEVSFDPNYGDHGFGTNYYYLKKKVFTNPSYIEIYDDALSPDECSRLLKRFDELPKTNGCVRIKGKVQVDSDTKSSIESLSKRFYTEEGEKEEKIKSDLEQLGFTIEQNTDKEIANIIVPTLSKYFALYKKKHFIQASGTVNLDNEYAFKKFEGTNDGFKVWHCEQGKGVESRVLVWNFYLNNASSGTEFLNFPTTKPKEGRLVIWPAAWTHTHRSEPNKDLKYIISGWWSIV